MTQPNDFELLELATPYALHAVSDAERAEIERRVAAAPASVATAFDDEVRAVRETMATLSAVTAVEPPPQLRAALLAQTKPAGAKRQSRWRTTALAAAAAVVIGLAAFGLGVLTRPSTPPTLTEQVLTAPDVRTVSRPLGNGTATVVFSRDRNAGVLVMNNVPPPSQGTVYQMWLLGAKGPTSAGTMGAAAVTPSTKATLDDLGSSTALAFTVEPGAGSPQPTGAILAELPLG
ncbi:anti-sigma-K factor RskA [Mycobacterium kubicae]|uniref:Anti-sigma-K factor RskA n=1 Tax=Mycobacterium kubicae TaxID=120959 RepID=A0AAX1JE03_9MYCO|nr:anti-sigma factor [Mycobacterium kubicae]MCV7095072.1 anti-sigma factor [Mycobacterium kubicae]ORV97088.1 anti-sigma factor [Mycobacterium kubicae]QNI10487.1 anti-sigma factor [Mycobacterium kubicae]QPI38696.1 anti-sigma factor [Mycobacterium kubicae]GFG63466.1 anti-sigma-K factor RskA [Mycobacterium kubicae]